MARREEDREDLIAEAKALIDRIEIQLPATETDSRFAEQPVICGYRNNGFFSVYFGQELHYQFDTEGRLRRAYQEPFLFRAQSGRLVKLERQRSESETRLVRTELSDEATATFLASCDDSLRRLKNAIEQREVPPNGVNRSPNTTTKQRSANVLRCVTRQPETTTESVLERIRLSIETITTNRSARLSSTIKGRRFRT